MNVGYFLVNCSFYLCMYEMFICVQYRVWRVFDPGRLLLVRVGNLNELIIKLGVFDPGRLLVVRVENLNELIIKLRVFEPGRLFVVRVGNLNELTSS